MIYKFAFATSLMAVFAAFLACPMYYPNAGLAYYLLLTCASWSFAYVIMRIACLCPTGPFNQVEITGETRVRYAVLTWEMQVKQRNLFLLAFFLVLISALSFGLLTFSNLPPLLTQIGTAVSFGFIGGFPTGYFLHKGWVTRYCD